MKAKRQNAAIMALLVFFFSVFPAKRSEAFAPPLIYAAYMTATTGAGTYSIAALAGAIGIAGMYLTVQDAMDNSVRIPLGPNSSNQPPAPAASATQVPATQVPIPAGSSCLRCSTTNPSSCGYAESCSACIVNYPSGYCMQRDPSTGQVTGEVYTAATSTPSCGAGYVLSGGSCVLQNARQASDDKTCDLLYAQGAFATASDMNCGSSVDGTKIAPMIRDGKAIAYGTNSSGRPLMWEVTPGPQTWTVTEYEQIQTATQTQVKQTTATIDAATSAVTSVQTQTSPGSISSPGSASVPTVTDPVTQPTSPTNTPTATTNSEGIVFPNDYARTGEAKNAADSITELMKPTSEVSDPTIPEWADNWGATFNPLKAWSMPGHSSSCPVGGFSWNGAAYTIDAHCQLINDHWSGLQTASIVVWTVTALWILLGA
jgi:hypothetical protein